MTQPIENLEPQHPEWVLQRMAVQAGEKTWDDFTIEDRTCHGWLLPYLFEIETDLHGRWAYWSHTLVIGKILDQLIPQINFCGGANARTMKMLRKCLGHDCCWSQSVGLPDFFEWLLWGFGETGERARIDDKVNEHWYRTLNLGLLLQYPHDYLGDILADSKAGRTYWTNPNAFFPTPHHVVELMARMTTTS